MFQKGSRGALRAFFVASWHTAHTVYPRVPWYCILYNAFSVCTGKRATVLYARTPHKRQSTTVCGCVCAGPRKRRRYSLALGAHGPLSRAKRRAESASGVGGAGLQARRACTCRIAHRHALTRDAACARHAFSADLGYTRTRWAPLIGGCGDFLCPHGKGRGETARGARLRRRESVRAEVEEGGGRLRGRRRTRVDVEKAPAAPSSCGSLQFCDVCLTDRRGAPPSCASNGRLLHHEGCVRRA